MFIVMAIIFVPHNLNDSKLNNIIDSHASSVSACNQISFKFTFVNPRLKANGNYQKNGSDYLLNFNLADGSKTLIASSNGQWKGFFTRKAGGKSILDGLIQADDGNVVTDCDPFNYNLLKFYGQTKFRCYLTEMLGSKSTVKYIGKIEIKNKEFEQIQVSHERAVLDIYFDPVANYLVKRVVSKSKLSGGDNKNPVIQEVEDFIEVGPGIFFPAKVKCYNPKTNEQNWMITFKEININQGASTKKYDFKFPPNILVMDKIKGGVFLTDSNGDPNLPAKNKRGEIIKLADGIDLAAIPDDLKNSNQASEFGEKSYFIWITLISSSLIIVILIMMAKKRFARPKALITRRQI